MADHFALHRRESLEEAFRRIAGDQLTRAATSLTDRELPAEERVHEARKRFKESRALMRLYRFALGDSFADRNRWYRDSGRALSAYRDASANVAAVEAITGEATNPLRDLVRERRDALYADPAALDEVVQELLTRFAAERLLVYEVALHDPEESVQRGLASTISSARNAMTAGYDGSDADFHEWRKRVKDQWYHVRLFERVWPKLMKVHEGALHELSDLLGLHHDLTVVHGLAGDERSEVIIARQKEIAAKARPIAEKVYAARPRDRARELMALWTAHTQNLHARISRRA
jgi:CHAD domain-containing protein